MSHRLRHFMLGAAIALGATPAHAEGWSFSAGADYTSGDYGETQDTTILIVPLAAAYDGGGWRVGVTVPYVRLEGSDTVTPGTGAGLGSVLPNSGNTSGGLLGVLPGAPAPSPVTVEEEGMGDVTLSFGVTPYQSASGRLTLAADVRLATADEALGADETIVSLAAGYAHQLGERASLYGALGYQRASESEVDAMFAGIGLEGFVSDRVLLGAGAEWAEASVDGRENPTQANLYASYSATDHVRIVAYALAGLTDASPDTGGGLRLVLRP